MDDEESTTLENIVYEPMEISNGEDATEEEEIIKNNLSTSTDSNRLLSNFTHQICSIIHVAS